MIPPTSELFPKNPSSKDPTNKSSIPIWFTALLPRLRPNRQRANIQGYRLQEMLADRINYAHWRKK